MLFKQQYRKLVKKSNEWVDSVRESRLFSNGRSKSQNEKDRSKRTRSITSNKMRSTNTFYLTSTRIRMPSRKEPQLDQLLKLINSSDIDKCKINYENIYMNSKKIVKQATFKCLESLKILNFDKINEDDYEQSVGGTKKYMENSKMPSNKNMKQPENKSNVISSVVKLKKFANKKKNLTFHENIKNSQGKIGLNFVWKMQLGGRRQTYAYFKEMIVKIEGAKTYSCQVVIRYQMMGFDRAFAFKKISGLESEWIEYLMALNNFQKLSMVLALFGDSGENQNMLSSTNSALATSISKAVWPATPTFSQPAYKPNMFSETSLRSFMKSFFIRQQIRFSFKESPNSSINSANIFESYYQVIKTKQQYSIERRASVKISAIDLMQPSASQSVQKSQLKLNMIKSEAHKNTQVLNPILDYQTQQKFMKFHNQFLYNYQKVQNFIHKQHVYSLTADHIKKIDVISQNLTIIRSNNEYFGESIVIFKMMNDFGQCLAAMTCQQQSNNEFKFVKNICKQKYVVEVKRKKRQKMVEISFRKAETRALRHRYVYEERHIDQTYKIQGGVEKQTLLEKINFLLNLFVFNQQLMYTSVSLKQLRPAFSRSTPNIKIHRKAIFKSSTNHYMVHTNIQNYCSNKSYLLIYLPKTQKTFMKLENINQFQKDFHDSVPEELLTIQFKRSIIKSNNSHKEFGSNISLKKRKNVIIRRDGLRSGPIRHSLLPMEKKARDNCVMKEVGSYCITCYISRQPSIQSDAHLDAKLFVEVSKIGTFMYICCSGNLIEVVRNMKIQVPRDRIINTVKFVREAVLKVQEILRNYKGTMKNLRTILKKMVQNTPQKQNTYRISRGSSTLTFIQGQNLRIFNEQREIRNLGGMHDRIDQTIDILKNVRKMQIRRRIFRRLYNFYDWCHNVGYSPQ